MDNLLLDHVLTDNDYLSDPYEASSISDVIDRFNSNLSILEDMFDLTEGYLERITKDIILYKIHEPIRRNFDLIYLHTGISLNNIPSSYGQLKECFSVVDDNIAILNKFILESY